MYQQLKNFLNLNQYKDPVTLQRALGTALFAVLLIVLGLVQVITNLTLPVGNVVRLGSIIVTGTLIILMPIAVVLVQRGQAQGAGIFVSAVMVTLVIVVWATVQTDFPSYITFAMATILLASFLVGRQAVIPAAIPLIAFMVVLFFMPTTAGIRDTRQILSIFTPVVIVQTMLAFLMSRSLDNVSRQVRTLADSRRMQLMQASNQITERLSAVGLNTTLLLPEIVNIIKQTNPQTDEVQLYLLDRETQTAVLTATTLKGRDGRDTTTRMQQQQIVVGSLSTIGRATVGGQTQIVRDTPSEQDYRRSSLLPGHVSSAILPLKIGNDIIGALDLQSRDANAFQPDDITLLETLAGQVAVTVNSAHLYGDAQKQLGDMSRTNEKLRDDLRDRQREAQQLIGGAWMEFLSTHDTKPAYTVDFQTGQIENDSLMTPALSDAGSLNRVITRTDSTTRTIALPISVRGQAIGAMEFDLPPDSNVSGEQMAVLGQLLDRVGLAAENARLLEDAQRRAQREALVNEIGSKMQAVVNVEAVVIAATQSIADALGAGRVAVRIGTPDGMRQSGIPGTGILNPLQAHPGTGALNGVSNNSTRNSAGSSAASSTTNGTYNNKDTNMNGDKGSGS